ncbi:Ig-like domain-containing protein [Bifidobacterium stellenboschense]|uniref:Arabinosidase n=1 Tax=Bifidobacterium stellenboschense TaxID=762211 RepID=A0A087DJP8_9BIFI|nr:Ig-like domain-containing protein [Bifidobacterium stellenboschense]KFI95748.1 arabinosidase [Bifidobacterium stellenboschense]
MNHWKKAVALIATVPMFAAFAPAATAADATTAVAQSAPAVTAAADAAPTLLASWDFTGKNGTSSGSIADSTGKYNLTLNGGVSVGKFGDRSNNEALNLNNDANSAKYAQIDDQLFKDAGDSFTLEFAAKTRHADDGNYFSLGVGKDNGNDTSKYLMFYSSTGTVKGVISDNGWHNEQGSEVNVANNNNIWHDYKIVVDGTKLAVYRDGTPVIFKADTGITMSGLGATTAYIGKSFYNADKYWNGAIDDIKVYKGAELASPTGVTISGGGVVDGKLALTEKSTAKLTATVTPDDAVSKNVTWSSSDEGVAKVSDDGTVTAVKAGSATITATTEIGGVKAELPVTVNPMDAKSAATEDLDAAISALKTTTTENLPLVAEGTKNGSTITWTSSDPKLITGTKADYKAPSVGAADPYQGAGVVTRPAYGDGDSKPVTLTATASYNGGEKVTKTVEVTVKEKTRSVPDGAYASVTFLSDSATTNGKIGEALYESATDGNNFFSFKEINGSDPVIVSNTDTKGLRDPYVLKSHDGDKFYMIATDLKVSSQGWGQNQQYGSLKLEAWESTDMVNWTRTNAEDGDTGIKVNADNMGMTWAPEAFWDDDLNAYVVFFSSREYTDGTRSTAVKSSKTGGAYNIVMMAITRDFKSYTPVQKWQDTQYSRIDSTVFKIGDMYYRLTKNEESGKAGDYITTGKSTFLERSKCLTCETTSADPNADVTKTWQLVDQNILPFEGPESIKLNAGDPNQNEAGDAMIIMADSGGYKPYMTSESAIAASSWTNRLSQTDGWNTEKQWGPGVTGKVTPTNMPTPTRHGAFVNVSAAIAENMHQWTTANPTKLAAVDSTTTLKYDEASRVLTATVKADDTGTVAGSVKFALGGDADGSWSETVKLDANGKASVTVPAAVAGKVTAAYDGYTDGLVKSSVSDPVTVAQGENPTQPEIVITGEGVKDGEVTLKVGDELDLHASLTQGDAAAADDELVWGDPSDPAVVEYVDQGANPAAGTRRVKALKVGTATIIVSSKADPKVTAKLTVKVVKTGETDATTPNKGDTTKPETKPNGAAKPSGNGGGLSATGAAVASVTGAVALLAAAGIALTVWRKRQA